MNTIIPINDSQNQTALLINGINVSDQEYIEAKGALENIIHLPVESNYNPTIKITTDLWYSFLGLINNQHGRDLEFQTSHELELKILKAIKNNRPLQIFAHSQGSIILRNVLMKLNIGGYSLSAIKVFTFGAANYLWPKNLQVFSFTNRSDYIARSLNFFNRQYATYLQPPIEKFKSLLTNSQELEKLEYQDTVFTASAEKNPIKSHEWNSYLANFKKQ